MHGFVNTVQQALDHDFGISLICPQCSGFAPLMQINRGRCPVKEILVENRMFVCEDCQTHTFLKLPV